jgi:transcriptional regulator with XRE-family HTH domain
MTDCLPVDVDSARERLAEIARARRLALGRSQDEVARLGGMKARSTVISVEQGRAVKEFTLYKLDIGLDWEPGSAVAVLNGGDPTEALPFKGLRRRIEAAHRAGELTDAAYADLIAEIEETETRHAQHAKGRSG